MEVIANQMSITKQIKRRKWNQIGHTLRKPEADNIIDALNNSTLRDQRSTGLSADSWRKITQGELIMVGITLKEITKQAKNKEEFSRFTEALMGVKERYNVPHYIHTHYTNVSSRTQKLKQHKVTETHSALVSSRVLITGNSIPIPN